MSTTIPTERGRVKMFDVNRRLGFIVPDAGGADIFVHAATLRARGIAGIVRGDRVEFEREQSGDGIRAVNVRLV